MLILASTSDIIRLVTGTASAVHVHASWVDNASGAITPGRTNTASITTAATTTIIAAPAAAAQRNVRHLSIHNVSTTVTTTVLIQHFDGTNSEDLFNCTLLPDEHVHFNENGDWVHTDAQGGVYTYAGPSVVNLGPTGTLAETMPRETCPEVNTAVPTASGTLFLQAIYLRAGQLVSNIGISSATTAAVTPTNYFFALYSGQPAAPALLAQSANQTTTAWAANTYKTLAMTTPYRVPTSGLYYIGLMMAATTVITTKGGAAKTGGTLASTTPPLHGTSTAALTTALPNPAAAITGGLVSIYANVL